MKTSVMILFVAVAALAQAAQFDERQIIQTLRNFDSFKNDVIYGSDGNYHFAYHVGDSERSEDRNEDGEVNGHYAFVAPEGDEYHFKYNADEEGYRVESDALPLAPEDTDEVKQAKKEFFDAYERALELADNSDYEYSEESYEDSDESDEDYSSEESSEEDDDDSDEEEDGFFGVPSNLGFVYNRK